MKILFRAFLMALVGLFACVSNTGEERIRSVFRYNESNGISSLDPSFARNLENMWAVNQVFDGLLRLDENLQVAPMLARDWQVSDDGLTYTFFLRNDVYFHDSPVFDRGEGRKCTAQDVAYSFRRVLDPALASPGKWVFEALVTEVDEAIVVANDTVLHLRLRTPFPPFLGLLTTQYARVVPQEAIIAYGADFRAQPVGTGPFKFAFWEEDVALVLHRNEKYWDKDDEGNPLPYLDAVKISFVRDKSAEYLGLLQGNYHFMSGLHPAYKDELLTPSGTLRPIFEKDLHLASVPFIKTDYIGILVDQQLPFAATHALNDVRVRRALSLATDRVRMARYLRNNAVYPATGGFIPRGLPAFSDQANYGFTYDPDSALKLLNAAGYPRGEGLPVLSLATTSDYADLCEFLQYEWSKVGITTKVDVMAGPVHRDRVANSNELLFRKSWLADYADEENFLLLFLKKNFAPAGPNYSHFDSPLFDSLYNEAMQTNEHADRLRLYRRMDSLLVDQVPVIPLYYDRVTHFIRNEVANFQPNAVNMLDLRRVKLKPLSAD